MSSSNHTIGEPVDLAAMYAAGAMSPEELADFERHLATGCERCVNEISQFKNVIENLFAGMGQAGIEEVAPSASVHQNLLARMDATSNDTAHSNADKSQQTNVDALADTNTQDPSSNSDQPNPQVWKNWAPDDPDADIAINLQSENRWESTGVDGIAIRRLFIDQDRNQMTALVRMAAGTAYPRHIHDTAEECLVLEGDLRAGDHHFRKGDYHRMAAGSQHGVQSTENGCLLLIISSLTDELID